MFNNVNNVLRNIGRNVKVWFYLREENYLGFTCAKFKISQRLHWMKERRKATEWNDFFAYVE